MVSFLFVSNWQKTGGHQGNLRPRQTKCPNLETALHVLSILSEPKMDSATPTGQ